MKNIRQPEMLSGLTLSPDGQTMAFSYEYFGIDKTRHTRTLGFYHFENKEFSIFSIPDNQGWSEPSYSWDGKKLVFKISLVTENGMYWDKKKFAVMDLSDFSYKIITPDWSMRFSPTFSPDGKTVLYRKPDKIRTRGKTRWKHWDIWEINICDEKKEQLTFYKYYQLGKCFYLPDGGKIIFSGFRPRSLSKKDENTFYAKYEDNTIFIVDLSKVPKAQKLEPLINIESDDKYYRYSRLLAITKYYEVLYLSRTNLIDRQQGIDPGKNGFNYDLFVRASDNTSKRLTKQRSKIIDAAISLNGSKVVFQDDKERNRIYSYWSINSDGTDLFEIRFPKRSGEWQILKPKTLRAID